MEGDFQCIICLETFSSREERNDHIERHFIHQRCGDCDKFVLVFGDLEFELHKPVHCEKKAFVCEDSLSPVVAKEECEANDADWHPDDSDHVSSRTVDTENSPARGDNETREEDVDHPRPEAEKPANVSRKSRRSSQRLRECRSKAQRNNPKNREAKADAGESDDTDEISNASDELKPKKKYYTKMEKSVPCPEPGCGQKFRFERTALMHRKKEHGFVQRHICSVCNREFKEVGNLRQHMQIHGESKRYICNYCGKGFHLPYNLKEHMNMHTGARPYPCSVCGKTFNRYTLRTAHMRVSFPTQLYLENLIQ